MSRPRPLRVALLILVVLLQGLGSAWALPPVMAFGGGHVAKGSSSVIGMREHPALSVGASELVVAADARAMSQAVVAARPEAPTAAVPGASAATSEFAPAKAPPCHGGMAMADEAPAAIAVTASPAPAAVVSDAAATVATDAAAPLVDTAAMAAVAATDDAAAPSMPCCDDGDCRCSAWCFGAASALVSHAFGVTAFGRAPTLHAATAVAALSPAHRRGLLRPPATLDG